MTFQYDLLKSYESQKDELNKAIREAEIAKAKAKAVKKKSKQKPPYNPLTSIRLSAKEWEERHGLVKNREPDYLEENGFYGGMRYDYRYFCEKLYETLYMLKLGYDNPQFLLSDLW
jgi:hypothetical protein